MCEHRCAGDRRRLGVQGERLRRVNHHHEARSRCHVTADAELSPSEAEGANEALVSFLVPALHEALKLEVLQDAGVDAAGYRPCSLPDLRSTDRERKEWCLRHGGGAAIGAV